MKTDTERDGRRNKHQVLRHLIKSETGKEQQKNRPSPHSVHDLTDMPELTKAQNVWKAQL